jgi:ABC-type oligopeptide transport system substrate-binding subunit
MKAVKRTSLLVLGAVGAMTLVACGGTTAGSSTAASSSTPVTYARGDDATIYQQVFGDFATAYAAGKAATDDNERYVKYAKAEAKLLESGAFVPITTQNGAYTISRIAPRTIPYVYWGNDMDKLKYIVTAKGTDATSFIKKADREAMIALWKTAREGGAAYDPTAYLTAHGYTVGDSYATTTSAAPKTLDMLSTSTQTDTEQMCNCIEGLIQYDNLGNMIGASADTWSWDAAKTTVTFHIRSGAAWYTSDKSKYADMKADDFVAGFQHMLDAAAGLEYLVQGVVVGVDEYLKGGAFKDVGIKAVDDSTLTFTLVKPESFFLTRLAYTCFSPMNRDFFVAHGGAFGISEFKAASALPAYTYGTSMSTQVYNSAFIPSKWDLTDSGGSTTITKNTAYWDAANVHINSATWDYDKGDNLPALYTSAVNGTYPGIGLSATLLPGAKADGNFDNYAYISDTTATTFFGGLNVNRGTFKLADGSVASAKTEQQKIDTETAMLNKNFRLAILKGWDRKTFNTTRRGAELAAYNIRNMYTMPNLVSLNADVTVDGVKYTKATSYGDLVQSFLDADKFDVKVADGQDGWFNATEAKAYMAQAKKDLGTNWPSSKIQIDVVTLSSATVVTAEAQAFKQLIEGVFPDDIQVNLVDAGSTKNYYNSGYYATDGASLNQDLFYGSGWGPDYGDPSTYLDTYLGDGAGYMTKVSGLF